MKGVALYLSGHDRPYVREDWQPATKYHLDLKKPLTAPILSTR
jgi:hypothetical protein